MYILRLVHVLAVVSTLGDQRVENQRRLRQSEGVDVLKLAQVEVCRGLFVAWRRRLGTGSSMMGHGLSAATKVGIKGKREVCAPVCSLEKRKKNKASFDSIRFDGKMNVFARLDTDGDGKRAKAAQTLREVNKVGFDPFFLSLTFVTRMRLRKTPEFGAAPCLSAI